ncbi:putative olfactory receptor 2B8 [Discoglossus pictus]
MRWKNNSAIIEFILLGFSDNPRTKIILFVVFFIIFLIILIANLLIIIAALKDNSLQTPMYFFLVNLAFLDIWYSFTVFPRMLRDLLSLKKIISFQECVTQMYISFSIGQTECILIAVMAYDRYVAICYPLHYTTIINKSVCIMIATGTWICGFVLSISLVAVTMNLHFCGRNKINHFECEIPEIIALGCGDVTVIEFMSFVAGIILLLIPVTFITISYINIFRAILKLTTLSGQRKAFSTCASHMMVVVLFYGSLMSSYMKLRSSSSPDTVKKTAIIYGILNPMLNPLIYTLRNKEVKTALSKVRNKNI